MYVYFNSFHVSCRADHRVSQYIFVVNAGSNTVTMMAIGKSDPTALTVVGQPATLPGEFPNTVAASSKHKLVCVGMTGAKAGVSCSSFSATGLGVMDDLRAIDLQQTTPPVGPTNTLSQLFFSSDDNTLFATVKGDPTKNNTGFLAAYSVEKTSDCDAGFSVSQEGVQSSPAGTAVLFGSSTIPGSGDLFVTDASFGAAVLSIDPKTSISTVKGKGVIEDQKATCWATVSKASGTAFVTDVEINRLVEMSLSDASILGTIDLSSNGDPGLIDLRAAGKFVYALSPGNGTTQAAISVVDVIGKTQVQHFQLKDLGVDQNAQGLTILM